MKGLKIFGVIFGAVVITALGIDASDTLTGKGGTLLGQLAGTVNEICPKDMTEIATGQSFTCIDTYEASADNNCPYPNPSNEQETLENLRSQSCVSIATDGKHPWRFISREQAALVCARAGKRLPKSSEWYVASVGTPDNQNSCNTDSSSVIASGNKKSCVSVFGVFDMVGNAWEWVADDVIDGKMNGRQLPSKGYVAQVDMDGIATVTEESPNNLFAADYFWSDNQGAYGVLRGGFYGSETDAGVYAVHGQTLPTSAGTAIGFRCVK